jgi:hypothetical protein
VSVSPKKSQARIGIQINIVALMTLDSTAVSVRNVRFHRVKASAVLTIASHRRMAYP